MRWQKRCQEITNIAVPQPHLLLSCMSKINSGWHALAEKMPGYGCRCIDEVKCYIGNLDGTHEGLVIANSQKAAAQIAGTPYLAGISGLGVRRNIEIFMRRKWLHGLRNRRSGLRRLNRP